MIIHKHNSFTFEWHEEKAELNFTKHQISFDEAMTVFEDSLAIYSDDEIHSITEERAHIIGMTSLFKLVTISFTDRDDIIRLINARKATKKERKYYESQNKYN